VLLRLFGEMLPATKGLGSCLASPPSRIPAPSSHAAAAAQRPRRRRALPPPAASFVLGGSASLHDHALGVEYALGVGGATLLALFALFNEQSEPEPEEVRAPAPPKPTTRPD